MVLSPSLVFLVVKNKTKLMFYEVPILLDLISSLFLLSDASDVRDILKRKLARRLDSTSLPTKRLGRHPKFF